MEKKYDYVIGNQFFPRMLERLQWDITSLCPLSCKHCRNTSQRIGPNEMSKEECFLFIEYLKKQQFIRITYSGGEPFARRDFMEILEKTLQSDISPYITSNGYLLNEKTITQLTNLKVKYKRNLYIQISLDGTSEIHNLIRGKNDAFARAINSIHLLQDNGIETNISVTIQPLNKKNILESFHEIDNILLKSTRVGFRRAICSGSGKKLERMSPKEYRTIFLTLINASREFKHIKLTSQDPILMLELANKRFSENLNDTLWGGCSAGISYISIDPGGDVYPCSYLPIKLGNIRETLLEDIWFNHPILAQLRNRKDNFIGKCKSCKFIQICGGCRADAYGQYGNFFQSDPLCWK
jgi:radical SAM protein with 4Fe4S-binding SPASM domain